MCDDCGLTAEGVEVLVDIAEGRRKPEIIPRWVAKQWVEELLRPSPLIYARTGFEEKVR
jgi:hypothetical protein